MFSIIKNIKAIFRRDLNHKLKDKIWFIHIPKNAGTSITKSLNISTISHIKAKEIWQTKDREKFENCFSFCIVRNPIERFVSMYNYSRMEISYYHNNIEPSNAIYGKHLDYETLKNASLYECALLLQQEKLNHDTSWNHWKPQYTWIYDEAGKSCLVNKVYKITNLDELQNDLFKLFKFKIKLELLNKSINKNELKEIDSKTMLILKDYYRMDFELFGY